MTNEILYVLMCCAAFSTVVVIAAAGFFGRGVVGERVAPGLRPFGGMDPRHSPL
jgi:hypothetical protein